MTRTRNRLNQTVDRTTGDRCRRRERAPRDEVEHHDGLEDVEDDPDVGERRLERVPEELLSVPVRGEQEDPGEDEVAPHDPAEPQPAALERRVEKEGRPEDVAGADEHLREARLDVPGEEARDELGEEEEPHREPGRSGGAEQTPAEACRLCHVHRSPSSPDRGSARSATDYASAQRACQAGHDDHVRRIRLNYPRSRASTSSCRIPFVASALRSWIVRRPSGRLSGPRPPRRRRTVRPCPTS